MTRLKYVVSPPRVARRREDYGFFGPGSPTWAVWSHPSLLIAGWRAAIVQMLHPPTAAGVAQHSAYRGDFHGRLGRTARYFATVALADGRSAVEAAERLRRLHARVTGIEPLSGRPYRATDPENQLWVHLTGWHSALYAYETYGPGHLPVGHEMRYWRECAIASELQDLDPAVVPDSRAAVRDYFASMRPRLAISEPARAIIESLLRPPVSWQLAPFAPLFPVLAAATVATIPRHLRELGGIDQPAPLDAAARPLARITLEALTVPVLERVTAALAPEAYAIGREALGGRAPLRDTVVSPAEARERLGASTGTRPPRASIEPRAGSRALRRHEMRRGDR